MVLKTSNCTAQVFQDDCRRFLENMDARSADLVFADPPFNINQNYHDYRDNLPSDQYATWTADWISRAWRVTKHTLALHGPDSLIPLYLECKGPPTAWIIWHYRFGQCQRSNWINAHAHCLFYSRKRAPWNPDDVLVPSDRATTYNDKRIHATAHGGTRLPGTVWGIPSDGPYFGRVQGNNRERRNNHPNQLPEVYLARIIRAYTNPGDLVLDPFAGSGTTAVVAQALGRSSISIDISPTAVESIRDRLARGAVRIKQ